jgi:hypothetical protein
MLKIEVISKAVHPSGQPLKFGSQRSGGDSMSTSAPRFLGVPLTEGAISPRQSVFALSQATMNLVCSIGGLERTAWCTNYLILLG